MSIKKLGPKRYLVNVSTGRKDPETGTYHRVCEVVHGTKPEAEAREIEIKQGLRNGVNVVSDARKMTYAVLSDRFHTAREDAEAVRPATLSKDRNIERHIVPFIGGYRIHEITPGMLTDLYHELRAKGVGEATVANCHRQVRQILGYAVKARYISFNPATAAAAVPKQPIPERPRFDQGQIDRLYTCISSLPLDAYSLGMLLAFHTGMRLGEVCGLTWGDIDLEHRVLHVERQRTSTGETAPLKTKSSRRSLYIDSVIAARLEKWRDIQRKELEDLTRTSSSGTVSIELLRELREKYEQGDDTPVLTNKAGHWLDTPKLSRTFKKVCRENSLGDLTFHSLRHLHFTIQATALHTDIKTVQQRGGWATSTIPMDVYLNGITEADRTASEGFGEYAGKITAAR